MSASPEMQQPKGWEGQTYFSRDFDEFLEKINNLGPKTVLVKVVQEPVLDEEGGLIGVAEFSFHTPGDRKDVYTEETRRGKEGRTAQTRVRLIMSIFPQVMLFSVGEGPISVPNP